MNARSRSWWGGVALAVGLWACQGQLLYISIEETSTTTVPKGTILEDLLTDFGFGDFVALDITGSQALKNQGVQPGDIVDVRLAVFDLDVVKPEGADLAFIESLDVFIDAPGLPKVLIATADNIPAGTRHLEMDLQDVDLTDYVVSKSLTISTDASGSRPEQDTTVKATFVLSVGVTPQGACNYITGESGA